MTTTFMDWVKKEVETIDEPLDPEEKVEEGEEVLGELTDYLRCFFTVLRLHEKALHDRVSALLEKYCVFDNFPKKSIETLLEGWYRYNAMWILFEQEVHEAFPGNCTNRLGVCQGFKVVKPKPKGS